MERLPHAYTNHPVRDGNLVVKRYNGPDAALRCAREAGMLQRLEGRVPVPTLIGTDEEVLRMRFVEGVPAQDLMAGGRVEEVLWSCGRTLKSLHALAVDDALAVGKDRSKQVLVHGDYGPNNLLLDPLTLEVSAVVDWEWAHLGDPLEDVAWCEWLVRTHWAEHSAALHEFWRAYGHCPPWALRHRAMVAKCAALVAFSRRWQPGERVRIREAQLTTTKAWTEELRGVG